MSGLERFNDFLEEYSGSVLERAKTAVDRACLLQTALRGKDVGVKLCKCPNCVKSTVREANEALLSLRYWEGLDLDFFKVINERGNMNIEFGPQKDDPYFYEDEIPPEDIENPSGTFD